MSVFVHLFIYIFCKHTQQRFTTSNNQSMNCPSWKWDRPVSWEYSLAFSHNACVFDSVFLWCRHRDLVLGSGRKPVLLSSQYGVSRVNVALRYLLIVIVTVVDHFDVLGIQKKIRTTIKPIWCKSCQCCSKISSCCHCHCCRLFWCSWDSEENPYYYQANMV